MTSKPVIVFKDILWIYLMLGNRDSVVGIATRYGLKGPGIKWVENVPAPVPTEAHRELPGGLGLGDGVIWVYKAPPSWRRQHQYTRRWPNHDRCNNNLNTNKYNANGKMPDTRLNLVTLFSVCIFVHLQ
jgi:hypothetical protein